MDAGVFLRRCNSANTVLQVFEFLMVVLAFYFTVSALCILLVPLLKGYSSIGQTLAKNQLYFDLLPNMLVMAVFILAILKDHYEEVAQLETSQEFKLRRRQGLGIANFILWTRMLFNLKSSKLMGFNLMVIQNILVNIPTFFCVFFIMIYVFSEFIWIGSKKDESLWVDENTGNPFLRSAFDSFRRMMTLSLYGNNEWLAVEYENDVEKIYYLVVWTTFTVINNTIMFNLLVSVLTVVFQQFMTKEEASLKLTQTETIQDMTFIEKTVFYLQQCFNKHRRFNLHRQYFYVAFYSHTYKIETKLAVMEKERFQPKNEDDGDTTASQNGGD